MIPDTPERPARLGTIIKNIFGADVVAPEMALSDLGSDSLLLLEFVLECEEEFGVDLGPYDEQISEKSTVAEIASYIGSAIQTVKGRV